MNRTQPIRALGMALCAAGILTLSGTAHADPKASEAGVLEFEIPGPIPLLAPTYGLDWAEVVRITDDGIAPRRIEIDAGQKVAWQHAGSIEQRISFDPGTARALHCTEIVSFGLEDGRLVSGFLRSGDMATLCELAPGTYRYRVEAARDAVARPQLSERPRGEIVVRPRSAVGTLPTARTEARVTRP